MSTVQNLKNEIKQQHISPFISYYYKYLDFNCFDGEIPEKRADMVRSLFSSHKPNIYRNDLITGSIIGFTGEPEKEELEKAAEVIGPLDRFTCRGFDHYSPNYRKTVLLGINGILDEIDTSISRHNGITEKLRTLKNMKTAMLGFKQMVKNYADKAASLLDAEGYDKQRLNFIAENCNQLILGAPQTFAQALQLVWFTYIAFVGEGRYAMALGRIDQYLYPFYKKDKQEGRLTDKQAIELLENAFMKIYEHTAVFNADDVVNIDIGGMDSQGNCQVNDLSYCVIDAVRNCYIPGPNLSARITPNTPDRFLDECLKSIGTGLGYPALMNDTVNIAALKRYGYDDEDIYDYSMVGCIENFITGKQPPWTDGRFDVPRFFEYMFNNGKGYFNQGVGIDTGPVEEIDSMQEFLRRFEIQIKNGAKAYMDSFYAGTPPKDGTNSASPFLSCFCDDCIERGTDINFGGAKYPSVHGVGLMGIGTTCDALTAVEKVIFTDKKYTLSQLRDALINNFSGYDELKRELLKAPKYGNDDDFVDKYSVWFFDYMYEIFAPYRTHDGGGIYTAMASNVQNISAGSAIGATPDGRCAGAPLSDAASPTYGRDVNGATATINSVTKGDYTKMACGTVLNRKFFNDVFDDEKRGRLLSLVKVYFAKGGQEMQINATSPEILRDAMAHPENYSDLVVRVSGFSALYVTLCREVQEDILARTQQR